MYLLGKYFKMNNEKQIWEYLEIKKHLTSEEFTIEDLQHQHMLHVRDSQVKALNKARYEINEIKKGDTKVKGVGDVVKKMTDFLGIKQCGACAKRQQKLNEMFPFKK